MKKIICLFFAALFTVFCTACKNTEPQKNEPLGIQQSEAMNICRLATLDCYFHNVVKYKEEDATGILWWKKDREFWIEYEGKVVIGVDASLIKIKVDGENVKISMPDAYVMDCYVEPQSLTDASFIIASNSAKIEAEQQARAFEEAQAKMKDKAEKDTALLASAKQRAKSLLEDYIKNIGEMLEIQYSIEWIDV